MQILIIDSSVQILDRLQELLSGNKNISRIDKTQSSVDAMELILKNNHKIVLLDGNMPGEGTLKILKGIKRQGSKILVIILCNGYDDLLIDELKLNGADFLFDKYHEFEKIYEVINATVEENK